MGNTYYVRNAAAEMEQMGLEPRDSAAWFLLLRELQRKHGRHRPSSMDRADNLDAAQVASMHVQQMLNREGHESRMHAMQYAFACQGDLNRLYMHRARAILVSFAMVTSTPVCPADHFNKQNKI